jgi:hypothetical protein
MLGVGECCFRGEIGNAMQFLSWEKWVNSGIWLFVNSCVEYGLWIEIKLYLMVFWQ